MAALSLPVLLWGLLQLSREWIKNQSNEPNLIEKAATGAFTCKHPKARDTFTQTTRLHYCLGERGMKFHV